jgi:very-short-patch-repair endonuclease
MQMKRANNQIELKTFRRELRNNLTPAEAKMWTYLKNKQLEGRRFRRQHSIAGFILDFYCPSERLGIELDGQGHFNAGAREYDRERDLFLKYYGVLVLRFVNSWVFDNPQGVLKQIKEHFGWSQKTNSSPPAKGEGVLKRCKQM